MTQSASRVRRDRPLREFLTGGDRRSIAGSNRVLALLRANLDRVSELVALTKDQDWLVVMRATDLLEKLAHEHPEWVEPYKEVFLSELADSDKGANASRTPEPRPVPTQRK
jgi:hypothetical protein